MRVVETVAALRAETDAARAAGGRVGLVPTMGYFHAGHRSLMEAARADNDLVVVSSFVNPTQFGPGEDLAAYPRDPEGDARVASATGVDVMFTPSVAEMYPAGPPRTTVHVSELTDGMCGAARPTHFDGVTTVVTKLLSITGPCRAYFGRKDYQQLAVVRRMTGDLNLPATVVGCPLVRERDGLAMSSRNAYLTPEQRAIAPELHGALLAAADAVRAGERQAAAVADLVRERLGAASPIDLEYVELRDARELVPLEHLAGEVVVAVAARIGRARLIDNVVLTIAGNAVEVDAGVRVVDGLVPRPAS